MFSKQNEFRNAFQNIENKYFTNGNPFLPLPIILFEFKYSLEWRIKET